MPPRPGLDAHLVIAQEVVRAHHVVGLVDLEVDVLDAGLVRREQGEAVMHRIEGHERGPADPVAGPEVEHLGPEFLGLARVGHREPDMAELVDAGVAPGEVAPSGGERPYRQVDGVSARVLEVEVAHAPACRGLLVAAAIHLEPGRGQAAFRRVECVEVRELQAQRVVSGVALEVADIVVAVVAAHVGGTILASHVLQPDHVGGELDRFLEIGRSQPTVAKTHNFDHDVSP